MSNALSRATHHRILSQATLTLSALAILSACSGNDDSGATGGDAGYGADSSVGSGAQGSNTGGAGSETASGGGPSQGSGGVASGGAGTGGLGSGSSDSGSGGVVGSGSSTATGGGGTATGDGGGPMTDPGEPALGSHEGDGTGCSAGQTVDACGICAGDGSTCDCYEGELCWDIVHEHNLVRSQVNLGEFAGQPVPDPPIAMVGWDPFIAAKAQEWADAVDDWSDGHSSQQFRTYQSTHHNGYHGENMAVGGGQYSEPHSFVYEGWAWDEAQGCTLSQCGGHYTQVVWRESIWIGCGRKDNVPFEVDGQTYQGTLTVCQYGPGGNGLAAPY